VAAARPAVAAVAQLREVAVVAPGAPQEAEVEPRGALPREAAAETADVPRLQAAVEALGVRVEAVEAEALGVLPQPGVKVGLPGARLMATLVVDPAAVSVG
jgi:hypothetical protein